MASAEAGNLAPHPHVAEPVLDRALERAREFADGDFGRVAARVSASAIATLCPKRRARANEGRGTVAASMALRGETPYGA